MAAVDIEAEIRNGNIRVESTKTVEYDQYGIKLHISDVIEIPFGNRKVVLSSMASDLYKEWDLGKCDYVLSPRGFLLAKTDEKISMSKSIVGFVDGRSSLARLGLIVHCTSMVIDKKNDKPEPIILEVSNLGRFDLVIGREQYICNISFATCLNRRIKTGVRM